MRISEILTPSFRALRDLTQISQISQMFLGSLRSKSEENLNENLINKNLENPFDLVETASLLLQRHATVLQASLQPEPVSTPTIPMGFQPERKKNQDYRFLTLNS